MTMLKRKLNTVLQRENSDAADYLWSSQSYTLRDIVKKFKLPCVATCSADDCAVEWKDFKFQLTQPILLHSTRVSRKLVVKPLRKDGISGEILEMDHDLVIPSLYNGWFHVIAKPDDRVKPDQTVSDIIASGADQFLVGRSVSGIDLILDPDDGSGEVEISKKSIGHGGILRVTKLYDTELNTVERRKTNTSTTSESGEEDTNIDTNTTPDAKYIMCSDEHEDEVVFPSNKSGFFYRIFDHEESGTGLITAEDLMDKDSEYPILVRHVIGEMPMLEVAYSNIMKCVRVIEEQTILASTLDQTNMAPLELQVDSDVKFKISLNDAKVKHSDTFVEAVQLCKNDGEDYLNGIKVAFQFSPTEKVDLPVQEKRTLSKLPKQQSDAVSETTTNVSDDEPSCYGSDVEEEDAQSDFEWTPTVVKRNSSKASKTKESKVEVLQKKDVEKPIPKFFNSSINSPMGSVESRMDSWNDKPELV